MFRPKKEKKDISRQQTVEFNRKKMVKKSEDDRKNAGDKCFPPEMFRSTLPFPSIFDHKKDLNIELNVLVVLQYKGNTA